MTAPTLADAEAAWRRAKQSESEGSQQAAWIGRWGAQNISKQGWALALGHASKWRNENFIVFAPQVLEKVSHFDYVFAYIKQRLSVFFGHAQLDKVSKAVAPPPVFQYTCHTHFTLGTGSANRAQFSTRLFSLWSVARLKALSSLAWCALCTSHCCWHCRRATPTRHKGKANSPGSVFATKSSLIHDAPF